LGASVKAKLNLTFNEIANLSYECYHTYTTGEYQHKAFNPIEFALALMNHVVIDEGEENGKSETESHG
ncbi:hypothetical protein, partial [Vibrio cidicii]